MTASALPNFLIVGAAKAGTTSLHAYLNQHRQIFMSNWKEPGFFTHGWGLKDPKTYLDLFNNAGDAKYRGEATTSYLTCPHAAATIHGFVPEMKIIIILRQPADRAFSLHQWMVQAGFEPFGNFDTALAQEQRRANAKGLQQHCPAWLPNLLYNQSGYYGPQIQRYLDLFPREQLLFLRFDDLVASPVALCRQVFEFLGVDPQFEPVIERHNPRRAVRSACCQYLLRSLLQRKLGEYGIHLPGLNRLMELNRTDQPGPKPDPATRKAITDLHATDIQLTEALTGLKLSHWLADPHKHDDNNPTSPPPAVPDQNAPPPAPPQLRPSDAPDHGH